MYCSVVDMILAVCGFVKISISFETILALNLFVWIEVANLTVESILGILTVLLICDDNGLVVSPDDFSCHVMSDWVRLFLISVVLTNLVDFAGSIATIGMYDWISWNQKLIESRTLQYPRRELDKQIT